MPNGPYRLEILPGARRDLAKLPRPVQQRVARVIDRLAREPRPPGARLLAPKADRIWRIRVADHRILYAIRDDRLTVLIIRVAHRGAVYRSR